MSAEPWLHRMRVADGRAIVIRRAAAGDETSIQRFTEALSADSRYQRYFIPLRELPQMMLDRLVQPDDEQGVALLAFAADGARELIGIAQYDAVDAHEAEVAVIVSEGWRRVGLAKALLTDLEVFIIAAGIVSVRADILRENGAALTLARQLGGVIDTRSRVPYTIAVVKAMTSLPRRDRGLRATPLTGHGKI